jgi:glycosyltransferase involved in cell wall biosynthesis
MERIPKQPPLIQPLRDDADRPLWSVMIPAYNCSLFLKKAMESVLAQDPGAAVMQIEVVDDASTDADVARLVQDVGRGRVSYYRQEQNVGSLRNFETCINRARGRYIHLMHGDDCVKAGFYKTLGTLFESHPQAGAAFCAWQAIDEQGNVLRQSCLEATEAGLLEDWFYKIAQNQRLQYVAIAVKREVYEALGSFYAVTYGEDWEMWVRIARHYPVAYSPEPLALYREHTGSISGQSFLSGKNIRDIATVINIIKTHIPPKDRNRLNRLARKYYIHWALDHTYKLWFATRNRAAVYNQLNAMAQVYMDGKLLIRMLKLLARVQAEPLRRKLKPLKPVLMHL